MAMRRENLLLLMIVVPSFCSAEVMDKEPALSTLWVVVAIGAMSGFFAFKSRWLVLFVPSVMTLFFLLAMTVEINNFDIGKAIRAEAGEFYVASVYLALLLILIGNLAGYVTRKRSRK